MQNTLGLHGPHGELTERSVTGAHEVVAAANVALFAVFADSNELTSLMTALHGAGAIALGSIAMLLPRTAVCDCVAVRPQPAPVSSTFGGTPPPTRVKVNFGHTFNVESNVLAFIVIDPVE